jgi:hypothetical protein
VVRDNPEPRKQHTEDYKMNDVTEKELQTAWQMMAETGFDRAAEYLQSCGYSRDTAVAAIDEMIDGAYDSAIGWSDVSAY